MTLQEKQQKGFEWKWETFEIKVTLVSFESYNSVYRRLSSCKQLGGLVPVFRLGVPLRYEASKLRYSLKIPQLYKNLLDRSKTVNTRNTMIVNQTQPVLLSQPHLKGNRTLCTQIALRSIGANSSYVYGKPLLVNFLFLFVCNCPFSCFMENMFVVYFDQFFVCKKHPKAGQNTQQMLKCQKWWFHPASCVRSTRSLVKRHNIKGLLWCWMQFLQSN